jgi:hypothetical protein
MTRIIGLPAMLLLLACLLQACSAVKIAYNQAPELAYWYLDSYVDFTGVQSLQVKDELEKLQVWHRKTQLPDYVATLQKLQQKLPADMDAAQVCGIFFDVRRKLVAISDQVEPAVAAVAGTLGTSQLTHMERKFVKGNADYREDFLESTPKASHRKRYKQAVSRAEMLYGRLDDPQLEAISLAIDRSGFDAAQSYAERVRRQQDALGTLRTLAASRSSPAAIESNRSAVRALLESSINSPDANYRAYLETMTQANCKSFAGLHNSTSARQRLHAVGVLHDYELAFRILAAK